MKPKLLTAILLFISAYAPLFIILAVKDFDFSCSLKFKHSMPIYILLGLTALSIVLLFYAVSSIKKGNMAPMPFSKDLVTRYAIKKNKIC